MKRWIFDFSRFHEISNGPDETIVVLLLAFYHDLGEGFEEYLIVELYSMSQIRYLLDHDQYLIPKEDQAEFLKLEIVDEKPNHPMRKVGGPAAILYFDALAKTELDEAVSDGVKIVAQS